MSPNSVDYFFERGLRGLSEISEIEGTLISSVDYFFSIVNVPQSQRPSKGLPTGAADPHGRLRRRRLGRLGVHSIKMGLFGHDTEIDGQNLSFTINVPGHLFRVG